MTMYFILIAVVLMIPLACSGIGNKDIREKRILQLSFLAVFMLMALKAPTVGRDIAGYKRLYEMMEFRSWDNYESLSWMEWGYELIALVFCRYLHASFQAFMASIYAFLYFSYYKFIKRYSKDYTTSVLLYICFTFLTFDTSAVRTMIGVAICLFAVPFAEKRGIKNTILFFAITLFAAQIHRSALIFIAVYFVIKIRFSFRSAIFYIGIPMLLLLFGTRFYYLINTYLKSVQEARVSIGGNLLIYVICLILTAFVWYYYDRDAKINQNEDYDQLLEKNMSNDINSDENELSGYFATSGLAMRMIYMAIILQLFSAGTVLTRMAEYQQLFILILVPNNMMRLNYRSRIIVKGLLYLFAIIYFWRFSLAANALDIVPYKFFWSM